MHKFIYPTYDSFISNGSEYLVNYGRDEILEVESSAIDTTVVVTRIYSEANENYINLSVSEFFGSLTGSMTGSSGGATGEISGCCNMYIEEEGC